MPFPYAYYTDNYDGPIHATRFKAKGYVSLPSSEITTDGDVDALERSVLVFNTSAGSITINSLLNIQNGQIIQIIKLTPANTLTIKNVAVSGSGSKFYNSTGSDIVFPSGAIGSGFFTAIQDGSTLKLVENKNNVFGDGTEAFPGIAFGSDVSTGFRKVVDGVSVSLAGVEKFKIGSNIIAKNSVLLKDGLSSSLGLAFESAVTTGLYKKATGEFALLCNAVEGLVIETDGDVVLGGRVKKAIAPIQFTNASDVYTQTRMGSLGVGSTDTVIGTNIPTNGIFSEGSIKTNGQFQGTATSALYADLAERYEADQVLEVGTIVAIGGSKEITIARDRFDVFGIISKDPGFKLNADAGSDDTHPYVALAGKTPCRVYGQIKKGDKIALFPNLPGVGWKALATDTEIVGRALEDKLTEGEGLIMVVTKAVI